MQPDFLYLAQMDLKQCNKGQNILIFLHFHPIKGLVVKIKYKLYYFSTLSLIAHFGEDRKIRNIENKILTQNWTKDCVGLLEVI